MSAQAEGVIRNIIREITLECGSRSETVSETLAAFMVKAAVLNADNEFSVERTLTKEDVNKLIQTCVNRLLNTASPSLGTIKMQVHFDMTYSTRAEFLQEHRYVLENRLQPIMMEIVDIRARSREELEGLYRKIVSYVLLRSGLGSPTDIAVVREATAALQSVFPQTELGMFMALSRTDKEKQLKELTSIVTGIRLFNRDSGKGGVGIDDLPSILRDAIKITSENIERELERTMNMVYQFTGVMTSLIDSAHPPPPPVSVLVMKECLINCRQHETYIKILMGDILLCAEHLDQLETTYQSTMDSLKNTVQSKSAVPTAQVYPLFISLSHQWSGYQDEVVLLSVLGSLLSSLSQFIGNSIRETETETFQSLLSSSTILTDSQRTTLEPGDFSRRVDPDKHRGAEFLFPETTKDFDALPLEFKGFCSYTLAAHDRLLLPSAPHIGVLHYRGKYYGFSSKEAAAEFLSNPAGFQSLAVDCSCRSPELIHLLNMHTHFGPGTPGARGGQVPGIYPPVTRSDVGTQTDTHFMESNIVKSYEWNEWELRRKAIKLANLRQKVTRSVQTELSHYLRDNDTQVYLPRECSTQTKNEKSTSVPKPSTYLAGLRGISHSTNNTGYSLPLKMTEQHDDARPRGEKEGVLLAHPVKVDLTLPVEVHNNITS